MTKIILSQNFDLLAQCLAAALQEREGNLLQKQWILVPNISLKQWLLNSLAKILGGVAACKICTLEQWLLLQERDPPSLLEMRCLIYNETKDVELTNQLSKLFFTYRIHGIPESTDWQTLLFQKLFPVQPIEGKTPLHCFGFDFLPERFWQFLDEKSSSFVYLFSPCHHFWEDSLSERQQGRLARVFKERGVSPNALSQLDTYLSEAPSLLANLGVLGRETLQALDLYSFDVEFAYAPASPEETVLHSLQAEILSFEKNGWQELSPDGSIEIALTGVSKLREVEALRDAILKKNIPFSEISVLAPDIQPYIPLIEYVFTKASIPIKFPNKTLSSQSSFMRGISLLISLVKGSFSQEIFVSLFEESSFGLKAKERDCWISWVKEIFQEDWKVGFAQMMTRAITLFPGPKTKTISVGDFDSLEELLKLLQSLEEKSKPSDRSLKEWAKVWEEMAEKFLSHDPEDEADSLAFETFRKGLKGFREAKIDFPIPFEIMEETLAPPMQNSLHGNHLHAVCCASIDEGSIVPSKAIFMIGMDEESFPRRDIPSSLNLLKNKTADLSDIDRYLFLKTLMSAKNHLYISYCHLSKEDGRQVEPSLVLQNLLHPSVTQTMLPKPCFAKESSPRFSFEKSPPLPLPGHYALSLSEISSFAKNPWRYFLQKELSIYLEDRLEIASFAMERAKVLKSSLTWPLETVITNILPKPFQEAFVLDAQEKDFDRKTQLLEWGKKIVPLSFLKTAKGLERPPLQINLEDGSTVSLTGDIPFAMEDGALHLGDDKITSLLKSWPEVLSTSIALKSPKLYFLKTGKIKTILDPETSLKKFLSYFLRCRKSLSPLAPDWADALLRKGDFSPDFTYEDVVNRWILFRLEIPKTDLLFQEWNWLRDSFSGLIELYPRGRSLEPL